MKLKKQPAALRFSPMTALAMVIFNHILSRISKPESGSCITLTMVAMSVLLADRGKSSSSAATEKMVRERVTKQKLKNGRGLVVARLLP